MKISRSTITPTAVALHRQMYTSFAEGDAAALRNICLDGLYDTFRARIAARNPGEKMEWEMLGYNTRSRLVSHRAARLQIASKQKLTRWARHGKELKLVKGSGMEKDVVEYLVLQRRMDGWKEGDWVVWGTTEETTLEDVMKWERKSLQ
jgi:protein MBA1